MQVDDTGDTARRKHRVPGKQKKWLVFCEDNELNRLTVQAGEQNSRTRIRKRKVGSNRTQEERCRQKLLR